MKVERIVASSFREASEQLKRQYGPDALVLSRGRAGDDVELFVAVDVGPEPKSPPVAVEHGAFAEQLAREWRPSAVKSSASVEQQRTATETMMPQDAAALVSVIRSELKEMEARLLRLQRSGSADAVHSLLLESGMPARMAEKLAQFPGDSAAQARILLEDLTHNAMPNLQAGPLLVAGPAGAGKTTVAARLAAARARVGEDILLGSLRDSRVGARERFHLIADRVGIESRWNCQLGDATVLDAGEMLPAAIAPMMAGQEQLQCVLVFPSHLSTITARRWLQCGLKITGVIVTHWDADSIPLGLLGVMAEAQVPLAAVAVTSDPRQSLHPLPYSELCRLLAAALTLVTDASTTGHA